MNNILHITKMKGISGSENHLFTLLSELQQRGDFALWLIILAEPRHVKNLTDFQQRLAATGARVVILPMSRHLDAGLIWRLYRLMRRERFDIVHTHLIHADLHGTIAATLAGVPAILSSKHNDDDFRHNPAIGWLNRLLTRRHKRIIVISDWIGTFTREVEGVPAEKIVRIHYGLDPDTVTRHADPDALRREFEIPPDAPVIGTIGRLTEQKGQRYWLEALKPVIAEFPDLRVALIGDGELRDALQQQAEQLGIARNLVFTGYRTDALMLLSGLDFFVFPSLWEGFGLVILEAMALQKAVIGSRVSAIPESVQDGETGILVAAKDVSGLTAAMLTLLRDPARARSMGEAGFRRLQTHFTVDTMVNETAHVYHDVLAAKKR